MNRLPLIARADAHCGHIALICDGHTYSYRDLLERSAAIARALLLAACQPTASEIPGRQLENADLHENRIALLAPAGFEYVSTQWGIWQAGGVVVPLSLSATEPEWEYALTDANVALLVTTRTLHEKVDQLCQRLGIQIVFVEDDFSVTSVQLPEISLQRRAMILYTSGTTSKPKGVVTTHANIHAQIESLVDAWQWTSADRIPLFLPLHHIHGIINVLSCALWSGATVETYDGFDATVVLNRVRVDAFTVFMAVPTIYVKLIQILAGASDEDRASFAAGFKRLRLMVSGSAALPSSVHQQWYLLTGQKLLERYGMTEIGMALSNPCIGQRRPSAVGQPLPGVEIRLKTETGQVVSAEHQPGEIQVRGPGVFLEYWNRPEVTTASFDQDWFCTGDVALIEDGYYRILGRQSIDIIKSGGYKLSALEIESTLLEHPQVNQCAVIGIPDETWGEAVAAAIVVDPNSVLDPIVLRNWCRTRLSAYKIPKQLKIVTSLPRNAMGKVIKPDIRNMFN